MKSRSTLDVDFAEVRVRGSRTADGGLVSPLLLLCFELFSLVDANEGMCSHFMDLS